MSMMIGEGLVGEGNEIAHIDLLIGGKDGPVGNAFANALARQSEGHTNLLAVITPNLAVKPATVLVTNQPGRIRDAVFQGLKAHFTDAQVVELTLRIALCGAYNKLTESLQIDNELSEPEAHGEPRLATGLGERVAGG